MMGLGRTGSSASNGSGDYALAFSTSSDVRRAFGAASHPASELANDRASALFQATVEAVEEAVYNSLFMATTVHGNGRTAEAIPLDRVRAILSRYGVEASSRTEEHTAERREGTECVDTCQYRWERDH